MTEGSSKGYDPAHNRKLIESQVDVKQLLIIDNGTETIKIGRSGVDYPSVIINTVSGFPHVISENDASPPKKIYFGKQLHTILEAKKYNVQFSYPIQHSRISQKGLQQMLDLWQYALTELMGVDPATAHILIIDSALNSKQYKAKIVTALFQRLKIASILFMNSSVLSLFSVGSTTGFVVELGHGTTTCVPVFQGFILNHALQHSMIAGKAITKVLQQQLKKNDIKFDAKDDLEYSQIIKSIKEDTVKVAYQYENQIKHDNRSLQQKSYELPDGTVVTLNKTTVYNPSQILFRTTQQQKSLTQMISTSLQRCNQQLNQLMMRNVVFCGGTSMIHGLQDRIHKQLTTFGEDIKINFDWQRKYSAWIGASMLGSLSVYQDLAISNSEHTTNDIIKRIF